MVVALLDLAISIACVTYCSDVGGAVHPLPLNNIIGILAVFLSYILWMGIAPNHRDYGCRSLFCLTPIVVILAIAGAIIMRGSKEDYATPHAELSVENRDRERMGKIERE
jgi:hypothetical protein